MRQRRLWDILVRCVAFMTLVSITAGCGAGRQVEMEKPEPEIIVARVDGCPITAMQLQEELQRGRITPASTLEDDYHKLRALDSLITGMAVRLEAEKMDLSGEHPIREALRQSSMQFGLRKYVEEIITPQIAVTEADVDTYWREHPEQFTVRREMVRPQLILIRESLKDLGHKKFPVEYEGWDAEGMINDLYRRLLTGEDFDTLALHYSQDVASRAQGGRLGWLIYDSTKTSPWQDSLFSFPTGRFMPPFYFSELYYIIRINGRRMPGEVLVPDTKMQGEVAEMLGKQRMDNWMDSFQDSLLAAGKLEIIDSALEIPIPDLSDDLPMAISNSTDTIFGHEFRLQSHFFKTEDGSRQLKISDKRRLLQSFHKLRVIWKAMGDLGYLDRPEMVRSREKYLMRAAKIRVRAGATDRKYVPGEEEIMRYYKEHPAEFFPERPVHVQHIVLDNPDTAWAVKKRLNDGADFVKLARQYYRGDPDMEDVTYDLGFIAADDLPAQFFTAAIGMKEGEISAPVQTEWGYHLIRVVELKRGTPIKKARQEIRSRLIKRNKAEIFQQWRDELLSRYIVEIDQEMLATVPIPTVEPADTSTLGDSVTTLDK